ncbi:MAG: exodeoxyribonuclease [Acidimicrobiales bacterium]|nr:exodeoxyribonuclease [Acidimicrobiales bacterium]
MSTAATQPFDLLGPLPRGRLAIEASAGTGKTFTLAALATRFVAEQGLAASELLVVTFTRAATSELRARIRERLATAASLLAGDGPISGDDPLVAHLARTDRAARAAHLALAVTEFDAATIATIHGFATQALGTLGAVSGGDRDAVLVDDARDLQGELCADVLAAAATEGHPFGDLPTLNQLIAVVEVALRTPDLALVPHADEPAASPGDHLLRELVARVLARLAEQRRRSGTRSFDDLLVDLRRELAGPNRATVKGALQSRYRVALIDEFQDTDPVQWAIFSELFGQPGDDSVLVLVGDPKQAIYSFRGADIHTYVEATSVGAALRSLDTNHRSDGDLLTALEAVLDGATFGSEAIPFAPVRVGPGHQDRHLRGPDGEPLPALSLRLAVGTDLTRNPRKPHAIAAPEAEQAIVGDLAVQVRWLLDHATLPAGGRVRPSDIAVLTRSASEGELIHAALVNQGVPAVLARGGSVLESPAADQWRWLLQALARPADPRRARAYALSWFCGRSAEWVATAPDDELAAVQDQVHSWADALTRGGVEELIRRIWAESGVTARVLARPDGDRAMTDLDHVAELLRTTTAARHPGVAGLLAALETDPEVDADADVDGNVASRRVESEAQAVQIMTIWVAKGLEFPIVCCPTMWRAKRGQPVIYQDVDLGRRALDLARGERWPDKAGAQERKRQAVAEGAGEELRLLYVALTRARHHALVWWSRGDASAGSALARVLFARAGASIDAAAFTAAAVPLPDDDAALDALAPLQAAGGGTIAAAVHGRAPRRRDRWVDHTTATDGPALAVARLDRPLDRSRHRWSFTAVTARGDHGPGPVGSEGRPLAGPDPSLPVGGADEGADLTSVGEGRDAVDVEVQPPADPGFDHPSVSPLAALPAGAAFGTLVHAVLEHVDFTADDLPGTIGQELDRQLSWRALDLTPVGVAPATPAAGRELLVQGLAAVVVTPLGPAFDHRRLRDIGRGDRLDEVDFELRLGDGATAATERDLGRVLLAHLAPDDPYRAWAQVLAGGAFGVELAGHLTGSIDAVVRVAAPGRPPRYVVVDYKTNRLHRRGVAPRSEDYGAPAMARAMAEHHYPLQALLYSVALHRYLRWRQPGYDPEVHLGGAAYLFVRGLSGEAVPTTGGEPHGVSTWAPPPALVVATSHLLAGGGAS